VFALSQSIAARWASTPHSMCDLARLRLQLVGDDQSIVKLSAEEKASAAHFWKANDDEIVMHGVRRGTRDP
jgi:hypothetical protein